MFKELINDLRTAFKITIYTTAIAGGLTGGYLLRNHLDNQHIPGQTYGIIQPEVQKILTEPQETIDTIETIISPIILEEVPTIGDEEFVPETYSNSCLENGYTIDIDDYNLYRCLRNGMVQSCNKVTGTINPEPFNPKPDSRLSDICDDNYAKCVRRGYHIAVGEPYLYKCISRRIAQGCSLEDGEETKSFFIPKDHKLFSRCKE